MSNALNGIKLIVGLGNPGPQYESTRHNAGAWFANAVCEHFNLSLKKDAKFNGHLAIGNLEGKEYKVLIPNTFMNHSGQSVSSIVKYYQIPIETILIAHDELDIPVGSIRFKTGGGHGGHNGLRDIIHHLHTKEFHRLRLGIGHPGNKEDVTDYVLERPSKADEQKIKKGIEESLTVFPHIIRGNLEKVMQQLHTVTE